VDADPPDYNPEAAWEAGGLARALAAVQAELPRIKKDKTARVEKNGVLQYTYKYADLADVSDAIMPVLAKHGLSFTCVPTIRDDGRFVLRYNLMHSSGDKIGGDYPLPEGGRPQDIGGWITYARRYALGAVTGVATEEDTDGRGEPQQQKRGAGSRPPANRDKSPGPPGSDQRTNENGKRPPTTANLIAMHFKRLGIEDDEERHNWVARMAGRTELASTANLPQPMQERILDAVSRARDIGKVQAWIDDQVTAS